MIVSPVLFRPQSLAEALDLLAAHADAEPISGGASLVAMMNADLVAPAVLISLTRIPELSGITVTEAGDIRIGAATRHSAIANDRRIRNTAAVVTHAASQIASMAVRNMGTIGGAVAHADPGLDFPPALMATDASVEVSSTGGRRAVPVRNFFVDWYTTALEPGEIVTAINIAKPKPGVGLYLKHARVSGDYAIVSIAVSVARDGEVRVAVGGCGPAPLASTEVDRMLSADMSGNVTARAADILVAMANPVDDVRGSAEYRRALIPRMLARALQDVSSALRGAA
jgi:aerobic carbon-monoxide dehydrogenase medium subunit